MCLLCTHYIHDSSENFDHFVPYLKTSWMIASEERAEDILWRGNIAVCHLHGFQNRAPLSLEKVLSPARFQILMVGERRSEYIYLLIWWVCRFISPSRSAFTSDGPGRDVEMIPSSRILAWVGKEWELDSCVLYKSIWLLLYDGWNILLVGDGNAAHIIHGVHCDVVHLLKGQWFVVLSVVDAVQAVCKIGQWSPFDSIYQKSLISRTIKIFLRH